MILTYLDVSFLCWGAIGLSGNREPGNTTWTHESTWKSAPGAAGFLWSVGIAMRLCEHRAAWTVGDTTWKNIGDLSVCPAGSPCHRARNGPQNDKNHKKGIRNLGKICKNWCPEKSRRLLEDVLGPFWFQEASRDEKAQKTDLRTPPRDPVGQLSYVAYNIYTKNKHSIDNTQIVVCKTCRNDIGNAFVEQGIQNSVNILHYILPLGPMMFAS